MNDLAFISPAYESARGVEFLTGLAPAPESVPESSPERFIEFAAFFDAQTALFADAPAGQGGDRIDASIDPDSGGEFGLMPLPEHWMRVSAPIDDQATTNEVAPFVAPFVEVDVDFSRTQADGAPSQSQQVQGAMQLSGDPFSDVVLLTRQLIQTLGRSEIAMGAQDSFQLLRMEETDFEWGAAALNAPTLVGNTAIFENGEDDFRSARRIVPEIEMLPENPPQADLPAAVSMMAETLERPAEARADAMEMDQPTAVQEHEDGEPEKEESFFVAPETIVPVMQAPILFPMPGLEIEATPIARPEESFLPQPVADLANRPGPALPSWESIAPQVTARADQAPLAEPSKPEEPGIPSVTKPLMARGGDEIPSIPLANLGPATEMSLAPATIDLSRKTEPLTPAPQSDAADQVYASPANLQPVYVQAMTAPEAPGERQPSLLQQDLDLSKTGPRRHDPIYLELHPRPITSRIEQQAVPEPVASVSPDRPIGLRQEASVAANLPVAASSFSTEPLPGDGARPVLFPQAPDGESIEEVMRPMPVGLDSDQNGTSGIAASSATPSSAPSSSTMPPMAGGIEEIRPAMSPGAFAGMGGMGKPAVIRSGRASLRIVDSILSPESARALLRPEEGLSAVAPVRELALSPEPPPAEDTLQEFTTGTPATRSAMKDSVETGMPTQLAAEQNLAATPQSQDRSLQFRNLLDGGGRMQAERDVFRSLRQEAHSRRTLPVGDIDAVGAPAVFPAALPEPALPTATPAAASESPEFIASQLIEPMVEAGEHLHAGSSRSLRLTLRPEDFGQVEVRITRNSDGQVNAFFAAERESVSLALSEGLPHLREALERAGLQIDQLSVQTGGHSSSQGHGSMDHFTERDSFPTLSSDSFEPEASPPGGGQAVDDRLLNFHA